MKRKTVIQILSLTFILTGVVLLDLFKGQSATGIACAVLGGLGLLFPIITGEEI